MSNMLDAHAKPLILQFQQGATEPTASQLARLQDALAAAFPARRVVLLPCGIEVAPGSQEDLMKIGEKLDALIGALAAEGEEEQESPPTSLDGYVLPGERNQSQSLG